MLCVVWCMWPIECRPNTSHGNVTIYWFSNSVLPLQTHFEGGLIFEMGQLLVNETNGNRRNLDYHPQDINNLGRRLTLF